MKNLDKINKLHKKANKAVKSKDFIAKLGGFTILAGLADFCAIQAARLMEQIILKGELEEQKKPSFSPHDDKYFYDKKIDTRKIINKIQKELLPKIYSKKSKIDINELRKSAMEYIKSTNKFLNYRVVLIHHIANPTITKEKLEEVLGKAIKTFDEMTEKHKNFMIAWSPYRFGEKLKYFYGNKNNIT